MPKLPTRLAFALPTPLQKKLPLIRYYTPFRATPDTFRHRQITCNGTKRARSTACLPANAIREPTAAYIHLPFCAQRCAYCAFTVLVSGRDALPTLEQPHPPLASHTAYVDTLCREITSFFTIRAQRAIDTNGTRPIPSPIRTVYLGGGTPSLLHPDLLKRVLETLRTHVAFADNVEITCEMDPATFTQSSANAYADVGVNRASIGAQSFNDAILQTCRRVHRAADIDLAVQAVRNAGITNVSLDLISGLPGLSESLWTDTLQKAVALQPEHVSVYDLALESGTLFAKRFRAGVSPLPTEDASARMLSVAARFLAAEGFERYEVSNFAKGAHRESRHNLAYWHGDAFFAFGIGATSLVDGFRHERPTRLVAYEAYVDSLVRHSTTAKSESERNEHLFHDVLYPGTSVQSTQDMYEDYVINAMRLLQEGVSVSYVASVFGQQFVERTVSAIGRCVQWERAGALVVSRGSGGAVTDFRLSEKGALVENAVVSDLLLEAIWRSPISSA